MASCRKEKRDDDIDHNEKYDDDDGDYIKDDNDDDGKDTGGWMRVSHRLTKRKLVLTCSPSLLAPLQIMMMVILVMMIMTNMMIRMVMIMIMMMLANPLPLDSL